MNRQDMQQLRVLYELREQRALEAMAEQRVELQHVQERLGNQEALIQSLRNELIALRDTRATENLAMMTVQSLKAESDRRRWLTNDLELEVFYLPGFKSDVLEARQELAVRRRDWLQIGDRIRALDQQFDKLASRLRHEDHRRNEARLDDRLNKGINEYG